MQKFSLFVLVEACFCGTGWSMTPFSLEGARPVYDTNGPDNAQNVSLEQPSGMTQKKQQRWTVEEDKN